MKRFLHRDPRFVGLAAVACLAFVAAGCGEVAPPVFRINLQGRDPKDFVLTGREDETEQTAKKQNIAALDTVSTVLYAFYGEPNEPYVVPESGLDLRKVELAAGPAGVYKSGRQRGLYRQHCAHCHGISGDGAGPTSAFLNPYPRDYRLGLFKFKSTERPAKPTDDDLRRILRDGIAGTAMPSFLLLPDDEIDALIEYVKYLAMRGETETLLELTLLNDGDTVEMNRDQLVASYVKPVAESWAAAESQIIVPPDRPPVDTPEQLADSLAKGAELFRGAKAQCMKCHGPTGMGDGSEERLFDDWNKIKKFADIAKSIAAAEENQDRSERRSQLKALYNDLQVEQTKWLLPQQEVPPRNLRLGVYRFGRRPADLYRRIFAGVNGTPMPQAGANANNPSGMTPEEIWHIVDYVRSLPYEKLSDPYVGQGRLAGLDGGHESIGNE